jgi:hypothetical protein
MSIAALHRHFSSNGAYNTTMEVVWDPEERNMDCKTSLKGQPTDIGIAQALRDERVWQLDRSCYGSHAEDAPKKYFLLRDDLRALDDAWSTHKQ